MGSCPLLQIFICHFTHPIVIYGVINAILADDRKSMTKLCQFNVPHKCPDFPHTNSKRKFAQLDIEKYIGG